MQAATEKQLTHLDGKVHILCQCYQQLTLDKDTLSVAPVESTAAHGMKTENSADNKDISIDKLPVGTPPGGDTIQTEAVSQQNIQSQAPPQTESWHH